MFSIGKVLIIILKGHRNIFLTFVRETTPLYRVRRRIQFYNIGKSVYFFIYFSANIFHYPEVVLPLNFREVFPIAKGVTLNSTELPSTALT